jgi:hypothetical protein
MSACHIRSKIIDMPTNRSKRWLGENRIGSHQLTLGFSRRSKTDPDTRGQDGVMKDPDPARMAIMGLYCYGITFWINEKITV